MLVLGGCVPFPRFVEEPYTDEVPGLELGLTTKKDVLELLGEPGATFAGGSEYVYTEFQEQVTLIGPDITIGESHYLVLSFSEDGVLSNYFIESSAPDFHGCIDAGWCADFQDRVQRLADAEQDAAVKQFKTSEDQCVIYTYGFFGSVVAVNIDGEDKGAIFGKKYFQCWSIEPGSHEIALTLQPGVKETWALKDLPSMSFDCVAGELVFIHLRRGWWTNVFEQVDPSEGRNEILERRLVISGPMRKIPDS